MQGNYYTKAIAQALGVPVNAANIAMLDEVEDIMRNEIFHSTLDWQTKRQFNKGARDAKAVYDYARTPEGRAIMARGEEEDEGIEDSPCLENCDDAGTGEGRYHGRI